MINKKYLLRIKFYILFKLFIELISVWLFFLLIIMDLKSIKLGTNKKEIKNFMKKIEIVISNIKMENLWNYFKNHILFFIFLYKYQSTTIPIKVGRRCVYLF